MFWIRSPGVGALADFEEDVSEDTFSAFDQAHGAESAFPELQNCSRRDVDALARPEASSGVITPPSAPPSR